MSDYMDLQNYFPTREIVAPVNLPLGHNGGVEDYGNFARDSRRQLNYLLANDTDVTAILSAHVAGVVGSKVNIQSRLLDRELNAEFEALIKDHGKVGNFDITGRFDRNEGLRLAEWFKALHGGILIRYHYSTRWDIPMRVELIGVDRIDTAKNDRGRIKNGIETDRYGRITFIWLFDDDNRRSSTRYSMKNITYYSQVWLSLDQYTSVSRLVTLLSSISNNSDYFDAELKAAIERAKAGVYWATELYSPIMDAFNKQMQQTGATQTIKEAKAIMEKLSARGVSTYGSTPIPMDDKIMQVDSNTATVFDSFSQQSQKQMAASVGGSAVSIYKDVAVGNYASIKAAIAFDEESYKISFSQLTSIFVDEYLERLFMVGVQTGKLPTVDKNEYFNNRQKYHNWDILRVSKRSVDEKVSAAARKMDLETGATTLVREYGEKGLDYIEERAKQDLAEALADQKRSEIYAALGMEDPKLMQVKEPMNNLIEEEIDDEK